MPKAKEPVAVDPNVTIEFNDEAFTVPRNQDDWPTTAYIARINAATSGRTVDWLAFVELLMGPTQWRRLTTTTQTGDFKRFLDTFTLTIKEECGL